jgi:hypothetical protein
MAKDRFYRSKPHVNVRAMLGLQKLGFSGLGVFQIARDHAVTNPSDRKLAAEILEDAASGLPTGKRQHEPFSVTKPQKPLVVHRFSELGFSDEGIQQLALGQAITGSGDQELLCEVLAEVADQKHREVKYYTITLTNCR